MSKWCGDENCLQCADKEPDPYVHLPREEYVALREQNRVLREALEVIRKSVNTRDEYASWLLSITEAALTATSQPGGEG